MKVQSSTAGDVQAGHQKRSYYFKMDATIKKSRQMLEHSFHEAGIDLTADQWVLINNLYGRGRLSHSTLAAGCEKDAATLTRILDILCKKKITFRSPCADDRRSFMIELTAKGNSIFELAQAKAVEMRHIGLQNLSDAEYAAFDLILDKIYSNICHREHPNLIV